MRAHFVESSGMVMGPAAVFAALEPRAALLRAHSAVLGFGDAANGALVDMLLRAGIGRLLLVAEHRPGGLVASCLDTAATAALEPLGEVDEPAFDAPLDVSEHSRHQAARPTAERARASSHDPSLHAPNLRNKPVER